MGIHALIPPSLIVSSFSVASTEQARRARAGDKREGRQGDDAWN